MGSTSDTVDITDWLAQYPWFKELPVTWKQVTHRLAREVTPERFVGLSTLHWALSTQSSGAVWDALEGIDLPPSCEDVIELLMR